MVRADSLASVAAILSAYLFGMGIWDGFRMRGKFGANGVQNDAGWFEAESG